MNDVGSKVVRGAAWLTAARLVVNGLSFVSTIILARLLSPDDFGVVALATTILAILTSVTDLSLANALVHQNEPSEDHYDSAWTLDFLRWILLAVILAGSSYPASLIFTEPRLVEIMLVLSTATAVSGLNNPKMAVFIRELDFRQNMALTVLSKLAGFVISVLIAFLFRTYWAIVAGFVTSQLAAIATSYWIVPYRPKFNLSRARELWGFSVWLSLGQVINTINWKFDQLMVGGILGRAQLGYYTVGDNLAYLPTREITAPLAPVLFPAFAKFRSEPARLREAYLRAQSLTTAVALPAGVGTALIAEPLVRLTMGEKWVPAVLVIQALASIFALQTLSATVQPLAMGVGETRRLFFRDTLSFILRLPTIIAGLYFWGLLGLVLARCATGTMTIFLNMLLVRQILSISITSQLSANWRALLSTGAMISTVEIVKLAVGKGDDHLHLLSSLAAMIVVGGLTYILATLSFWWIAKRPPGPEQFAFDLARKLLTRMRR